MSKIINAANIPLNQLSGTVPNVSGALKDYFQKMVFAPLEKTVSGFRVVENVDPIDFWGVIMPLNPRQLMLKPEGERAWTWFQLFAEPGINLSVDDVIQYLSVQYRVMGQTDFSLYGYIEYQLVQDFTGSGP